LSFIRVTMLSGILLLSGGCFLQKKPAIQVPVAAPPAPSPSPSSTPPPTSAPAQAAPTQPAPASPVPSAPAAEPAKPSPFPPVGNAPNPKPVTPTPLTPAPELGTILPPDQRRQLDAAYQSDLRQANAVLSKLSGRTLTPEQTDSVNRARTWIRQAAQYHDRDLTTAAELVRRAKVLTQDLAGALK
jgi:hypothetical protein